VAITMQFDFVRAGNNGRIIKPERAAEKPVTSNAVCIRRLRPNERACDGRSF